MASVRSLLGLAAPLSTAALGVSFSLSRQHQEAACGGATGTQAAPKKKLTFPLPLPSSEGYVRPNDPRRLPPAAAGSNATAFDQRWSAWAYGAAGPAFARAAAPFEASNEWARVDDVNNRRAGSAKGSQNHAIEDALGVRAGAVPHYRMFLKKDGSELVVVAHCGRGVSGHGGILHGGVTSLLFDEATGWMNAAKRLADSERLGLLLDPAFSDAVARDILKDSVKMFGFTAFLHVNFRAPFFLEGPPFKGDGVAVIRAEVDRHEGRKMFLKAKMVSADGEKLHATAEALYVQPR